MLLNFSNHPAAQWSEKQIAEAEKLYDKIIDLEFPEVPPDADENFISLLVDDYVGICIDIFSSYENEKKAVHIMGELTFTYNFVKKMQKKKIECIASTSARNVRTVKSKKITQFDFVKFRAYR